MLESFSNIKFQLQNECCWKYMQDLCKTGNIIWPVTMRNTLLVKAFINLLNVLHNYSNYNSSMKLRYLVLINLSCVSDSVHSVILGTCLIHSYSSLLLRWDWGCTFSCLTQLLSVRTHCHCAGFSAKFSRYKLRTCFNSTGDTFVFVVHWGLTEA